MNPITKGSAAEKDGRIKESPPPIEIADILVVKAVNQTLGTNLTPAEVDELPTDYVDRVLLVNRHVS